MSINSFNGNLPPYPMQSRLGNADFLNTIIPAPKGKTVSGLGISTAHRLLQSTEKIEESKKLWIGKLPLNVPDSLIERILKVFGNIDSWKWSTDAKGNCASFGFCAYEDIKSVYLCYTFLNEYEIYGSVVQVKLDPKTLNYL